MLEILIQLTNFLAKKSAKLTNVSTWELGNHQAALTSMPKQALQTVLFKYYPPSLYIGKSTNVQ